MTGSVNPPLAYIASCREVHGRLREALTGIVDTDVGRASLLPGWSIGHLVTHLARNAETMCRRIEAATHGLIVEQYPGGSAGRADEIEQGARRSAEELRRDVADWSTRLDELFDELPADVWARPVRTMSGREHPVAHLPFMRWCEVEIHLVDLGIGITPAQWSDGFIDRMLPRLINGLRSRGDDRELCAWLLGRGAVPTLGPWG